MTVLHQTPPRLRADRQEAEFFEDIRKRVGIAAVADLNQTIANPPTQAEVQAISEKIDELLAALRATGIMAT